MAESLPLSLRLPVKPPLSVCEEFAAPHPTPPENRFAFLPQALDYGSLHFREFADLAHALLEVRPVGDFGTVLLGRQNNQFCQRSYEVVGQGGSRNHALRDRLSSGRISSLCTQFTGLRCARPARPEVQFRPLL
jgi:hypothetical protein